MRRHWCTAVRSVRAYLRIRSTASNSCHGVCVASKRMYTSFCTHVPDLSTADRYANTAHVIRNQTTEILQCLREPEKSDDGKSQNSIERWCNNYSTYMKWFIPQQQMIGLLRSTFMISTTVLVKESSHCSQSFHLPEQSHLVHTSQQHPTPGGGLRHTLHSDDRDSDEWPAGKATTAVQGTNQWWSSIPDCQHTDQHCVNVHHQRHMLVHNCKDPKTILFKYAVLPLPNTKEHKIFWTS